MDTRHAGNLNKPPFPGSLIEIFRLPPDFSGVSYFQDSKIKYSDPDYFLSFYEYSYIQAPHCHQLAVDNPNPKTVVVDKGTCTANSYCMILVQRLFSSHYSVVHPTAPILSTLPSRSLSDHAHLSHLSHFLSHLFSNNIQPDRFTSALITNNPIHPTK